MADYEFPPDHVDTGAPAKAAEPAPAAPAAPPSYIEFPPDRINTSSSPAPSAGVAGAKATATGSTEKGWTDRAAEWFKGLF